MRLIDADAIDVGDISCFYSDQCKLEDVQELIDDQPTIHAHPVKRGHWINHFDDLFPEESTIECSVCHEHSPADMPHDIFCPNCGSYNGGE